MHRTLLALFLLIATCSRAHADEVSEAERAQALFRQGAELARQYRWPDALRAFEQAARLRPHARTSYNLGYCERGLERLTRARHWFRDAIHRDDEHQRSELSGDQRRAAETYLAEAEARIAHLRVEVSPADVRIIVDDRPLDIEDAGPDHALAVAGTRPRGPGEPTPARAFELLVDPGRHDIVISAKDGRSKSIEATVAEGEVSTLRLELRIRPPPEKRPTPRAPIRTKVSEPQGQIVGAAVLTGLGAAAAMVGTAFAVKATVVYGEAQDACPNRALCASDRAFDLSQEAQTYGNLATATLVTAGASTVGATLLWLTAPSGDDDVEVSAIILARGVLLVRTRY